MPHRCLENERDAASRRREGTEVIVNCKGSIFMFQAIEEEIGFPKLVGQCVQHGGQRHGRPDSSQRTSSSGLSSTYAPSPYDSSELRPETVVLRRDQGNSGFGIRIA